MMLREVVSPLNWHAPATELGSSGRIEDAVIAGWRQFIQTGRERAYQLQFLRDWADCGWRGSGGSLG